MAVPKNPNYKHTFAASVGFLGPSLHYRGQGYEPTGRVVHTGYSLFSAFPKPRSTYSEASPTCTVYLLNAVHVPAQHSALAKANTEVTSARRKHL